MLTLPNAIVPVLNPFATLFRNPTDRIASTKPLPNANGCLK